MGGSHQLPSPQQSITTTYVYYVVMLCSCGHSYYYPARRQLDLDQMSPEFLLQEIQHIPERIQATCSNCGQNNNFEQARRAVIGVGFPDRSGCILCDFALDRGRVVRKRYRFDESPDPIHYFRENPDYFRTRPPEDSPSNLDDFFCRDSIGRVLNVRSTWTSILQEARTVGHAFTRAGEGYYMFATRSKNPKEIESQIREHADEEFWEAFENSPFSRRRLHGVERWPDNHRKRSGLDHGTFDEWLPTELVEMIRQGELHAIIFSNDAFVNQHLIDATDAYGIELDEIFSETGQSTWWLRHENGHSREFPSLELVQLVAAYKGRLISDQIWETVCRLVDSLEHEKKAYEALSRRLPPHYSLRWEDRGAVRLVHRQRPMQALPFGQLADTIDLEDKQSLGRLVSWLTSEGACESPRYVGKRLVSKARFQEFASDFKQESSSLIFRERHDKLFEVYTDECEDRTQNGCQSQVFYGFRTVTDNEQAEMLYLQDLHLQRYSLQYTIKRNFFRSAQMLALIGEDASSIALHPALLRGVMTATRLRLGTTVRVFAPFNGVLIVSKVEVDEQKLEEYGYQVARQMADVQEWKSDKLSFLDIVEMTDESVGTFELESLERPVNV